MASKLFEFVILEHPVEEDRKKGASSKVLVDVQRILAPDEKTAGMLAGRQIPEDALGRIDRLEIALRPF